MRALDRLEEAQQRRRLRLGHGAGRGGRNDRRSAAAAAAREQRAAAAAAAGRAPGRRRRRRLGPRPPPLDVGDAEALEPLGHLLGAARHRQALGDLVEAVRGALVAVVELLKALPVHWGARAAAARALALALARPRRALLLAVAAAARRAARAALVAVAAGGVARAARVAAAAAAVALTAAAAAVAALLDAPLAHHAAHLQRAAAELHRHEVERVGLAAVRLPERREQAAVDAGHDVARRGAVLICAVVVVMRCWDRVVF